MTMKKSKNLEIMIVAVTVVSLSTFFIIYQTDNTKPLHSDGPKILGHVEVVLYGQDGMIKAYRESDNQVVTNGDNATTNILFGTTLSTTNSTGNKFQYIGVGTSSTSPAATQTNLLSQQSSHRLATITNGNIHGTVQLQATWPANRLTNSSSVNIAESAVFDGGNKTNMFARQTFTAINANPADSLTVTWTITIT